MFVCFSFGTFCFSDVHPPVMYGSFRRPLLLLVMLVHGTCRAWLKPKVATFGAFAFRLAAPVRPPADVYLPWILYEEAGTKTRS